MTAREHASIVFAFVLAMGGDVLEAEQAAREAFEECDSDGRGVTDS